VLVVLLAVRVLMLVFAIASPPQTGSTADSYRFEEIGRSSAQPWREMPVEYPPVQLLTVEAIAGDGEDATRDRLALLSFAGDVGTAGALAWAWGRRTAVGYLLLAAPLLPIMYWRIDPFFLAFAVGSVALARKGYGRWAGAGLAVATLARLWPLVIVPTLGRERLRSVLPAFAAVLAVATLLWIWIGGIDALRQVLTFRGAEGWSVDGSVGSLLWASGGPIRIEQGSIRIGEVEDWQRAALAVALAITLGWTWWRSRDSEEPTGIAATTSVAALLTFSPLSSIQYVVWLLPWAAVASSDGRAGRRMAVACAGASIAAGAWVFTDIIGQDGTTWPMRLSFLAKNLCIAATLVIGLVALGDGRRSSVSRLTSPATRG
jgi:hypothetical protein